MSVGHLLTVRRAWLTWDEFWTPRARALSLARAGVFIGRRKSQEPVGAVLATGRFDRPPGIASVDAFIAAPMLGATPASLEPKATAPPRLGDELRARDGSPRGRIVAVDLACGQASANHDFWVAPPGQLGGTGFGDSGLPLYDTRTGALVGMHIGEARKIEFDGAHYDVVHRAHAIHEVASLFGLGDALDPG